MQDVDEAIKHFSGAIENENQLTLRSYQKSTDKSPDTSVGYHRRNFDIASSADFADKHLYHKHQQLLKQSKTLPPSPKFSQENSRQTYWRH